MSKRFSKIKSSNLIEYFYYFSLIAITIIFILGGALYLYFSSVLRSESIKSNNNTLEQLKNAQDIVMAEVDKSVANIVLDSTFNSFMDYYKTNDSWGIMLAQGKVNSIILANEYIDSLSIYYINENIVLSYEQGIVSNEVFYDKEFIKSLDFKNVRGYDVKSRVKKAYNGTEEVSILSFIKSIPINYSGTPKAIAILNIKGSYLQNMFDSIKTNPQANIMILDSGGKVISKKSYEEVPLYVDIKKDMGSDKIKSTGYFIKKINNSRMLVSYIYSEKYRWTYVYTVPMSVITSSITFLGIVTVVLCIILILMSFAGAIFFSMRIYSPIKGIMRLISNNSEQTDKPEEDKNHKKEMAVIEQNINNLIDNNKLLENKNKSLELMLYDFEVYQKNKFLKNLVEGTLEGDKKLEERLSYYDIEFFEKGYFVALAITIDNYDSFKSKYSEKQQNMLYIYISECVDKYISERYKWFIVETNSNENIIVVNLEASAKKESFKGEVYNLANIIHENINENMNYTFTIGVSNIYSNLADIHKCYREGVAAANLRLLLGHNNVIFYENTAVGEESTANYPISIERTILNALKLGDYNGVMVALGEFTVYIMNNTIDDMEFVRHYFLQLVSSTTKLMYELDMNLELISVSEKDIYSSLIKMETVQNMEAYLKNLYEEVIKYSQQKRSLKNSELIKSVIVLIENNLTSDLSMVNLAEKFYISSSHLRKIFKDETGNTIKEYIDKARIQKAQELLIHSNTKIYDIAEQAGYQTVQAFLRAFKLSTGKTPGEYRTLYAQNNLDGDLK